jgi:serine/threonine protein kinase
MDIWSLGCCVLEMATGRRPWSNLDNEWAVMYHVVTGHPPLPDPSQLSELGMDFLKQCFIRSAQQRPSAIDLLKHPWIDAVKVSANMEANEKRLNGSVASTNGTSGTSVSNSTTPNISTPTTPFNNIESMRTIESTLELASDKNSRPSSPSLLAVNHEKEHVDSQEIFMMEDSLPSNTSVVSVESEDGVGISADPVTPLSSDGWSFIVGGIGGGD